MLKFLFCRRAGGLAAGTLTACVALVLTASPGCGETLESALVQAYQNNPSLNSQRAATRAIDEGVPQALSGYRPKVAVTADRGSAQRSSGRWRSPRRLRPARRRIAS